MPKDSELFSDWMQGLATPEPARLGPQGRPGTLAPSELEQRLGEFFQRHKIAPARQSGLRSAALLWHDHLDASHAISQDLHFPEGSWLHGIMHRREPDYGNAGYWFHRVGRPPGFGVLAARLRERSSDADLPARLLRSGEWQSLAFIDACEEAERAPDSELNRQLRQIQALEFEVLVQQLLSRV